MSKNDVFNMYSVMCRMQSQEFDTITAFELEAFSFYKRCVRRSVPGKPGDNNKKKEEVK